jgi:methyl-accepting chemotaxis protein
VREQSETTAAITADVGRVAQGAGQIADNVAAISTSTDETSVSARTTQEAAAALTRMASEVDELIGRFTLAGQGSRSA